jgi:hypothetical protein
VGPGRAGGDHHSGQTTDRARLFGQRLTRAQ